MLDIAYEESGPADGAPVILLHGFPYDPRAYDGVVPLLPGCRVLVPYLRGYGPTRFLSADTMRSGEQAALGNDLREFMDALGIKSAVLAGYDWGGRAACIVAALWPERARGLVTCGGYNMHDVKGSAKPASAEQEHRYWYQYYFCTPRGEAGLTENRRGIAKLLWTLWSPNWRFDDATFAATAASFDNPDFVDGGDPLVPRALRLRAGRSGAGVDRGEARRAAEDRGPDHRAAGRGARHRAAGRVDLACAAFHRAVSAPHATPGGAQRAAGSARRDGRRRSWNSPGDENCRGVARAALHKSGNRTYLSSRRQPTERR